MRFLPTWNLHWLKGHALNILSTTFEVSYSDSSSTRIRYSNSYRETNSFKECSIFTYFGAFTNATVEDSWLAELGDFPSSCCDSIIGSYDSYQIFNNYVEISLRASSSFEVSECFRSTFDSLDVDQMRSLRIPFGLVLSNKIELLPQEQAPSYMQYLIEDESERVNLQWAAGNKFDCVTSRTKPTHSHENFALSQLFAERPSWMEQKYYLTFTSLLADPYTFLGKLPYIFSCSPVMLPISENAVQVLIRQGLHTLGPHWDLTSPGHKYENPRIHKAELYNKDYVADLIEAILGYVMAMSGLSTEHQVLTNCKKT